MVLEVFSDLNDSVKKMEKEYKPLGNQQQHSGQEITLIDNGIFFNSDYKQYVCIFFN